MLPEWKSVFVASTPVAHSDVMPTLGMAVAEIDPTGYIVKINEVGEEVWGLNNGMKVPRSLWTSLQKATNANEYYPVELMGLKMSVLSLQKGGWMLMSLPISEAQKDHSSPQDLVVQPTPEPFSAPSPLEKGDVLLLRMKADCTVLTTNSETEALTGYTPSELIGRKFLLEILHPEDRWKLTKAIREVAETNRASVGARFQFKGEDKTRFVEIHLFKAIPESEGNVEVLILDGGEQSDIDADLFLSESLYRAFLEQSPMGVIHLDETGLVIFENYRFRQLVGEAIEDAWIGQNVYDLPIFKGSLDQHIQQMLRTGQEFKDQEAILKTNNAFYHFHVHGSAIRHPDGYFVGGVLLFEDISAQIERAQQKAQKKRYINAETALRDAYFDHDSQTPFLEKVVGIFAETSEAHQAYILLRSDNEQYYLCHAAHPPDLTLLEAFKEADYPILRKMASDRRYQMFQEHDVLSSDVARLLDKLEAQQTYWCPFFENGRPFGFVVLAWQHPHTPSWQDHENQLMQDLVRSFEALWGRITAEVRYNQTVDAIDECLFNFEFSHTGNRTYTFITPQIEQLMGYNAEEFLRGGRLDWLEHIVEKEDRKLLYIHDQKLREGKSSEVTYRALDREGNTRWIRESASPHRDSARRVTVGGILIDVTDHKSVEADLLNAKRAAESANQLKSAFLATMSHEIRTPLGAVNGFAELLSRELSEVEEKTKRPMPSQVTEFITAIRDNSQRLLSLVNDLFDLSNLETGMLSLRHISVPLHELILRSSSKIAVELSQKGIELKLNLAQNDLVVVGDPQRIQQVMDNLLENAAKFTENGTVAIHTTKEDQFVVIEIADTGIGMSQEYVSHLFTPFMQEDRRLNRRFKGTGLGLALVKRIIEAMGGKIEVKSEKGKGSTFRVFLPFPAE